MPSDKIKKPSPSRGRHEGSVPTYQKIVEALRRRLNSDEWIAGKALPSFRQLAAEYNVGVRVIRMALDVLKQEDRIEMNPRRHAVAKAQGSICTAINQAVVLVLTNRLDMELNNPDNAAVIKGIQRGTGKRTDPLLIVHDARRTRDRLPPDLVDLPFSGILLFGTLLPEVVRAYADLKLPVVCVDRPMEDRRIVSVCVDNVQAAKVATKRLLELGHRRIALLRFVTLTIKDIDPDSKERTQGFRLAYEEAGLAVPEDAIFNYFAKDRAHTGAYKNLLDAKPSFTAVVCVDPRSARFLVEAAQARGIGIPRQLSIVCFHSQCQAETNWSGPCTDFELLGERAVEMLGAKPGSCIRIPAPWHEGKTVAPPIGSRF